MRIHRTPKSGLFLMELALIILFFAMTSAVCVNLFVSARLTSIAAKDLNHAVIEAQSAAESIKQAMGDDVLLAEMLGAVPQGETLVVSYDQGWLPTTQKAQERYQLRVIPSPTAGGMRYTEVEVLKGELILYKLKTGSYTG